MDLVRWGIVGSLFASLAYLAVLCIATVVEALRTGGRGTSGSETDDALASSRLTIPVSLIVSAGSAPDVSREIRRLLGLNYPDFEVIVVVDAPAVAVEPIQTEFELESMEFFYRRTISTAPVRRIFRSQVDPRLMVVEKEPAHPSDALNVGLNLARFRFVGFVPPGIDFEPDALLRSVAPALLDPRSVVGVSSRVEQRLGERTASGFQTRVQRLRSLRELMLARLFGWWYGPTSARGPAVRFWRRDTALALSGFSSDSPDPELSLMLRLASHPGHKVVSSREPFGWVEVQSPEAVAAAAQRHQRATLQGLQDVSKFTLEGAQRRGPLAFFGMALVTPALHLWVILATVGGVLSGMLSWPGALAVLALLSFGTALLSCASLLLRGARPASPSEVELRELLLTTPLELAFSSPRIAVARLMGVFGAGGAT